MRGDRDRGRSNTGTGLAPMRRPQGTCSERARSTAVSRCNLAARRDRGGLCGSGAVTLPLFRAEASGSSLRGSSVRNRYSVRAQLDTHSYFCSHSIHAVAGAGTRGGGCRGPPGMEQLNGLVRSVTTPEFADITFHEVMCKSALNHVPGRLGDAVRLDGEPVPRMHACLRLLLRPRQRTSTSNSTRGATSTRRSS